MKTLILYATKHGATREAAQRIAKRIPGAAIYDLKQSVIPSLADFDSVIFGSSIYVGSIRKEAKAFLVKNSEILKKKKLGIFLCGLQAEEEKRVFASNFSPDILAAAKATSFLGGIFDPKKAGFLERLTIKGVAKLTDYADKIDNVQIERFTDEMKS